jgi:protein-disulfide isomerase
MKNLYFLTIPVLVAIIFSFLILNYGLLDSEKNDETSVLTQKMLIQNGSPVLGDQLAEITILEFGDYQCTFCYKFHKETLPILKDEFINSGKIKMVFKDFPLNGNDSKIAGEATYCAEDQNKYWEYHNTLYENWAGERTGWIKLDVLYKFAKDIELDFDEFSDCLNQHKYLNRVLDNERYGIEIDIDATPTFLVFDDKKVIRIIGAQPIDIFRQVINEF